MTRRRWLFAAIFTLGCGSPGAKQPDVADGRLKLHDDLFFVLTRQSQLSEEPPVDRYEIRDVREPLDAGENLRVRLVTKILDERERALLARDPDAIGEVWPNSLMLTRSKLVQHVTDVAWEAVDYDPSGLAHDSFEGGHSIYRTPAKVTLHVAFVHRGALVVVHATAELERTDTAQPDQAEVIAKYRPVLERAIARVSR